MIDIRFPKQNFWHTIRCNRKGGVCWLRVEIVILVSSRYLCKCYVDTSFCDWCQDFIFTWIEYSKQAASHRETVCQSSDFYSELLCNFIQLGLKIGQKTRKMADEHSQSRHAKASDIFSSCLKLNSLWNSYPKLLRCEFVWLSRGQGILS